MIIRVLLVLIFATNCYGIVSSYQREIDYDKMLREGTKTKQLTPAEVEEVQKLRRESRNAEIEYKLQQLERPKSVSRASMKTVQSSGQRVEQSVNKVGHGIIIALIILFLGVFMLLYSSASFSRKREREKS